MPNYITNTAIVNESWNGRGLITHGAVTKPLITADDGTLWAAVREGHVKRYINIYRSTDGGFSWENMYSGDFLNTNRRTGIAGLNQNGPFMNLTLQEDRDRLILWHTFFDNVANQYSIEPFIFDITLDGLVRKTDGADFAVTGIGADSDQLAQAVSYTDNHIYLTYTSFSKLTIQIYNHTYQISTDGSGQFGSTYFNTLATNANDNNTLDIAILRDDTPNYTLVYIRYNRLLNTFDTPVAIAGFPKADIADVNISRDGSGNLCVLWNQESADGLNISQRYGISKDNGGSWVVTDIPFTPNQTAFTDTATVRLAGRTVLLAGLQGFLVGYVRNLSTKATAYMRTLTFDGTTYVLGDEKIVVDEPCTGYRFFRQTGNELVDLDQIEQIRIAYQVGQATSQTMTDTYPVAFKQQLLREALAFKPVVTPHIVDVPVSGQVLVTFNMLGTPSANQDYFAAGLTGAITKKYMAAFKKTGTALTFSRYEPNKSAESSDRSAYGNPTKIIANAVVDPGSYSFPDATGDESFTTYVERDQRKIHIPPSLHPGRTFTVNAGNHLKRTVWLFELAGNEYEISQVVPRFVDNQIAYYEANAYVVGPSNNPFSRVILPSET